MSDSDNFFSAPAIAGAGVVALLAGGLGVAPYCALAVIASAPNDATNKVLVILDFISRSFHCGWVGSLTPLGIGCGVNKRQRLPN
jgi:hypothetical protein